MDNFFYDDEFYSELGDLLEDLEIGEDNAPLLPDDYCLNCVASVKEPIFELNADWIGERIDEERFPEESEDISTRIQKVLNANIDFEKVNAALPKLYYPTKEKFKITKQNIIEYLS